MPFIIALNRTVALTELLSCATEVPRLKQGAFAGQQVRLVGCASAAESLFKPAANHQGKGPVTVVPHVFEHHSRCFNTLLHSLWTLHRVSR